MRHSLITTALFIGTLLSPTIFADVVEVTTLSTNGPGSLNAAIEAANKHPNTTKIRFNIPNAGTIKATLPEVIFPIELDGSNPNGKILLENTWAGPGGPVNGLTLTERAKGSTIHHLSMRGYRHAIEVLADNITIRDNHFTQSYVAAVQITESQQTLLFNNQFSEQQTWSVRISNSQNSTLLNNQFLSGGVLINGSQFVKIGAGSTQGNYFNGTGSLSSEAGILAINQSNNLHILNNEFHQHAEAAVRVINSNNSLIGFNRFTENQALTLHLQGGKKHQVLRNQINGRTSELQMGLLAEGSQSLRVIGNQFEHANIKLVGTEHAQIGGYLSDGNLIKHGQSSAVDYAAIHVLNGNETSIINNQITDNTGYGIFLESSQSTKVSHNWLERNTKTALRVSGGLYHHFSKNVMRDQKGSDIGWKNSIALFDAANFDKVAPEITAVKRSANSSNIIEITGVAGANDVVEVYESTSDQGNPLFTEARQYLAETQANAQGIWTAKVLAHRLDQQDFPYFTAIATDQLACSSPLALSKSIAGIDGPTAPALNTPITYQISEQANVTYNWWIGGNATLLSGQGSNSIKVKFHHHSGPVTINVNFVDFQGKWQQYSLPIPVIH